MAALSSSDFDDLELEIPVNPLFEEFSCPICICPIRDCHLTECGHNFCKTCVLECLNRKHSCPFCNHPTTKEKLVKNHHFDKVLAMMIAEKEAASKRYFEKVINAGASQNPQKDSGSGPAILAQKEGGFSPIEQLFHKYLTKSLAAYEDYNKELKKKSEKNISKIKEEYAKKMTEVSEAYQKKKREDKNHSQLSLSASKDEELRLLKAECEKQIGELEKTLATSSALLLEAYEKYLKELPPAPSFLPVSVTLSIPTKGVMIEGVQISTTDTIRELREILKAKLLENGNPLLSTLTASNVFVLKRKFEEKAEDIVLLDENRALVQYRIDPGDFILLKGEVQLLSDKPKECFSLTYKPGDKIDYFSCKTCAFNWVCKNCSENCHQGHVIVGYIQNHAPTWACCYCPKNKKCKLPHKNK